MGRHTPIFLSVFLAAAVLFTGAGCEATPAFPNPITRFSPAAKPASTHAAVNTSPSTPKPGPRSTRAIPVPSSFPFYHPTFAPPVQLPTEPTATVTPAPNPTDTLPTPTFTAQTHTPEAPALDISDINAILNSFAYCNGRYQGNHAANRRSAAVRAIAQGQYTYQQIQEITANQCTPVGSRPTPDPPPPVVPAPTQTPTAAPANPEPQPSHIPAPDWRAAGATHHPSLVTAIDNRGWAHNGNSTDEATTAHHLVILADATDTSFAKTVLAMPFLDVPTPPDAAAVQGLHIAARTHHSDVRSIALEHPNLRNGIRDQHAGRIAVLPTTLANNPSLARRILNADAPDPQRRTIHIDRTTPLHLEVIRAPAQDSRHEYALDALEKSLRFLTIISGRQPPVAYFALVFIQGTSGGRGTYHFSHIAIHPNYDVPKNAAEARIAAILISHELAHYWWHDNQTWLDEGMADTLAILSNNLIDPTSAPCPQYTSIRQLEQARLPPGHPDFSCHYSLGSRLFLDLRRELGATAFQASYQRLYAASLTRTAGVNDVRAAFPEGRDIIDRHYDGANDEATPQPQDDSPSDAALPQVNGRITSLYTALANDGPPTQQFSAQHHHGPVFPTVEYEFDYSGPPITIPIEVVVLYQDGHAVFRHNATLNCDPNYSRATYATTFQPPRGHQWTVGRYDIYIYRQDKKAAESSFTVIP